jgi:peptidoglycan/LPS O-acetylase OafA/YrhL
VDEITADHKKWFKGIDSLRFILALIVLLSHFKDPFSAQLISSPSHMVRILGYFLDNAFDGTAAVIAFFIISGFVIHYPNKSGIVNVKKFWIRRFVRIFVPLIIVYLIGIKFGHPDKAVVWSLICELAYYAIYPFMVKIKLSWFYKFLIAYAVAAILIIIGAHNDVASLFKQADSKYHGYYWQLGSFLTWIVGLPVWLLGVLLAEHIDRLQTINFSKVLLYRIGVIVLSCFFTIAKVYLFTSYIISMNLLAILIYKWLQAETVYFKHRQPLPWLEKMGKFSYSLYLCHPIIYMVLGFWLSNTFITYPIFIAATIFISWLFYLGVERPAHLLAIRIAKKIT